MRLLIYADLHATDGNDACFLQPALPLQHYRIDRFFKDILRIYKEHRCSGIIDLGDTTDDRTSIPVPTLDLLCSGIDSLPASDWNFKLTGNHEQYLRNAEISNRRLFAHKFSVVEGCEVFDFGGYMAFFCSYSEDFSELGKWIADTAKEYKDRRKILFGHFPVVGARMNSGPALQGVPVEALKSFDLALLGHVHLPQSLTEHIHFVGSPFQQDWGEAGENKRVGIFDTDDCTILWVPLKGYPVYNQVTLDEFQTASQTKNEDRYKVVLSSQAETEAFFKHPLFHRAEPVYKYDESTSAATQATKDDWSFEGIATRYMSLVPLKASGIDTNSDEVLEVGKMIANGEL